MDWAAVTFKPTEAAVVAQVGLRDVNRAIDEHILPASLFSLKNRDREVVPLACVFISFYVGASEELTAGMRKDVIRRAAELIDPIFPFRTPLPSQAGLDYRISSGFITVDLAPFVRKASEGWHRLQTIRQFAHVDDRVLGGSMPVVRGTRIPVHDLAASLTTGSVEDALNDYPGLDRDQIELARLYAAAYPLRGRPAHPARPPSSQPVSTIRVPRNRV